MNQQKIFAITSLLVFIYIIIWTISYSNITGKYKPGHKCCQEDERQCHECQYEQMVVEACVDDPGRCSLIQSCCKSTPKRCSACVYSISLFQQCGSNSSLHGCGNELMLGIPLTNKAGYTKFTSSIWSQYHKFPQNHIHVFDDFSSTENQESTLREWYGDSIQYFPSSKRLSVGANIRRLLEYFANSDYKILVLVNNASILRKGWQDFIKSHIFDNTDGFLSLYHSANMHDYNADCTKYVGDLCEAEVVGEYGVVLTRPLVKSLITRYKEPFDELDWRRLLRGHMVRFFYPPKSLNMQIGQVNQGSGCCGENEVAYRFNRCEFPEWIKKGIEFFFDRCTNSSEIYSPEHSMSDIETEGRFWTRPVVSYSLYGDHPSYIKIALENARRVFLIYPGWKIWLYHDNTVTKSTLDQLCEYDIHFVNMSSQSKYKNRRAWRFLVASEPVKLFAIRDIDSWLLPRGKAAVNEWIASGKLFHVMRDSQYHKTTPIMGGMWGARHEAVPNMAELLEKYNLKDQQFYHDQWFLSSVIWPMARRSVWQHDSHPSNNFGETHPFPTKQQGRKMWVGNIIIPHERG